MPSGHLQTDETGCLGSKGCLCDGLALKIKTLVSLHAASKQHINLSRQLPRQIRAGNVTVSGFLHLPQRSFRARCVLAFHKTLKQVLNL